MLPLDSYRFRVDPMSFDYDFVSDGPKGRIKKIARFSLIDDSIYNFAFGDLDEATGEIDDISESRNEDMEKILATVANIIFYFTSTFPNARVFIIGSTPARTRLYQVHIGKFWLEIDGFFYVWGQRNDKWENFQKGVNYNAFLGQRK